MYQLASTRDQLSSTWHSNTSIWDCSPNYTFKTMDQYLAFCASKDWIQDTCDVLLEHRTRGFHSASSQADLEFWGIMQAVYIQQDALYEMEYAFTGERNLHKRACCEGSAWAELRELRNLTTGHPNRKDRPRKDNLRRSVTGRLSKTYDKIHIQVYEERKISGQQVALGPLIDRYEYEAVKILQKLHGDLKSQLSM